MKGSLIKQLKGKAVRKGMATFFAFFLAMTMVCAQDNVGVRFLDNTYQEAQQQAKAEGKMIFVDCYTPTCGPCKAMLAKEFPKKEMGDYLNNQFVSVKMDLSVGEGAEMNKQWNVSSFPTFLFMTNDGEILYRLVGYKKADVFIDMVKKGLAENKYQTLRKQYDAGERSATFIQNYMSELERMRDRKQAKMVADEYLKINHTFMQTDTLAYHLFYQYVNDPYDKHFIYVYQHRNELAKQYGEPLHDKLYSVWMQQGGTCADFMNNYQVDETKLNDYKAYMNQHQLEYTQQIVDYVWLMQGYIQKDKVLLWKISQQYGKYEKWVHEPFLVTALEQLLDLLENKKEVKKLSKLVEKRIDLLKAGKSMETVERANRDVLRTKCIQLYEDLQKKIKAKQ